MQTEAGIFASGSENRNMIPGLSCRMGEKTMKAFYTESIANGVRMFLEYKNIRYVYREEIGVFVFLLGRTSHPHARLRCGIIVNKHCFNIYAQFPHSADITNQKQVNQLCRMFAAVNYDTVDGCYEFDGSDGEIRYKVHRYCPNDAVTFSMISSGLEVCERMIGLYEIAIISVMFNLVPGDEIAAMIRNREIQKEKEALNHAAQRSSQKTANADLSEEVIKFVKRLLRKKHDLDDGDLSKPFRT
jgi:hypothetical protein